MCAKSHSSRRRGLEWTPLHLAASAGEAEAVAALLRAGADPNAESKDKWTALHLAGMNGASALSGTA
mgnify:CR=1 FL=1|jgi:ankyrin repeat protein